MRAHSGDAGVSPLEGLRRFIGALPGVLAWRKRRYARLFAAREQVNLYHGIFDSFESALASAPSTKPVGYDHESAAALYADLESPLLSDYPAMHWLQRGLDAGARRVVDLGGHVGIKYYAFRNHLRLPEGMQWVVCDVPAVASRGAEVAVARGATETLSFASDPQCMAEADLVLASGSVQYLPIAFTQTLASLARLPARVVVNRAALHPSKSFFTLNSIGVSFCPYRVQAEPEFVAGMTALGYIVEDRWEVPRAFRVPFEPAYDFDRYVGFAFRR
jgi:putative methyltransferase (TIGR04325 family)